MSMDTLLNVVLMVLLVWLLYKRFAPVKGLKNVSGEEFAEYLKKPANRQFIDVREPFEFKSGHIPGAINLPLSQLKKRIQEVNKDKEVFLYCRSGSRSKQAARVLAKHGVNNMFNLVGGIGRWPGKTVK